MIKRSETTDLVHPFCFTDEKAEAQRNDLAYPVSQRKLVSKINKKCLILITTDNFYVWVIFFWVNHARSVEYLFIRICWTLFIAHLLSVSPLSFSRMYPDFHLDICSFPNSLYFGQSWPQLLSWVLFVLYQLPGILCYLMPIELSAAMGMF